MKLEKERLEVRVLVLVDFQKHNSPKMQIEKDQASLQDQLGNKLTLSCWSGFKKMKSKIDYDIKKAWVN